MMHRIVQQLAFLLFLVPGSSFTASGRPASFARLTTTFLSSSAGEKDEQLNSALVFVKPHANNLKVQEKVRELLLDSSLDIITEGDIAGSLIDEKKLIDRVSKILYFFRLFPRSFTINY